LEKKNSTQLFSNVIKKTMLLAAIHAPERVSARGRPRTGDYISDLAWTSLGVEPAKLSETTEVS